MLNFRDRRGGLTAKLIDIDKQLASEETRGRAIPQSMRDEVESMKAPIYRELDALAAEEGRVTAEWREASRLVQALDQYVASLKRSN